MGGGSGGGNGGGSGSSGQIDYPAYMKDRHAPLYDTIKGQTEIAVGTNPYGAMTAFDPLSYLTMMASAVSDFDTKLGQHDPVTAWPGLMDKVSTKLFSMVDQPALDTYLAEQNRKLDDEFFEKTLPKYRAGMRDNGAVNTSAYKIGEALLYSKLQAEQVGLVRDTKGKIVSSMLGAVPQIADSLQKSVFQMIEYDKTIMHYKIEHGRMSIAALYDKQNVVNDLSVQRVIWPMEMEKYAMDALGCISGSAASSGGAGKQGAGSRVGSAIGGALSGAATGAMLGSAAGLGFGAPVGAAVGGLMGLAGGLFG
ncbi:MAG: hypothetical protein RR450_04785 [Oscillospiraceae bacterium]